MLRADGTMVEVVLDDGALGRAAVPSGASTGQFEAVERREQPGVGDRDAVVGDRLGGEEFALIFPGEASGAVSCALEVIRKEIASRSLRRRSTNDDLGAVTISGGFAERQAGESLLALMERADAALYRSKRTGRNLISAAETRVRAA